MGIGGVALNPNKEVIWVVVFHSGCDLKNAQSRWLLELIQEVRRAQDVPPPTDAWKWGGGLQGASMQPGAFEKFPGSGMGLQGPPGAPGACTGRNLGRLPAQGRVSMRRWPLRLLKAFQKREDDLFEVGIEGVALYPNRK